MKPVHTPIAEYETFLESEKGKQALLTLKSFPTKIRAEFTRVEKSLPVKLSDQARKSYMDFDMLGQDLKKHLLYSGLLIDFQWEEWNEGLEIVQGIRKIPNINPIKILKLLSVIMYQEKNSSGFLDDTLKNGLVLELLEGL
jgi:hypothetical protein